MYGVAELMCKKMVVKQTGRIGIIDGIDIPEEKFLITFEDGSNGWFSCDELTSYKEKNNEESRRSVR